MIQKYYIDIWGYIDSGQQRSFTDIASYSTTDRNVAAVSIEGAKRVIEHGGSFGTTIIEASFGENERVDITVTADENERVDITKYLCLTI